jgi:hypothetical protein
MFTWLRVAIPVLVNFLPKEQCLCRSGIRTAISDDLLEYFGLEQTHQYWDHFVALRNYCLFHLYMTDKAGLNVSSN